MAFLLSAFVLCAVIAERTVLSQSGVPNISYQLTLGTPSLVSIAVDDVVGFTVSNVAPSSRFLVMQVYTQHASLNLTQTSQEGGSVTGGSSVKGNSVGLVGMLASGQHPISWTVQVAAGSVAADVRTVPVVALVQEYGKKVPIPGGCNQVFDLENDPNIRVQSTDFHTQVWFQWARGATNNCELPRGTDPLTYQVYVGYVAGNDDGVDSLVDVIRSMATADKMESNAQKVVTIDNDGNHQSRVMVSSERGRGAVYGVVVRDDSNRVAASYVSGVTYACNDTAGDCSLHTGPVGWVVVVVSALVGLFLVLLGHQYLKTEMTVVGFLATTLVCFALLTLPGTLSDQVCLAIAAGVGVVGGVVWLMVWVIFSFPSVSVLLPGLCAGYLVAASVFFTPFANISWWATSLNYGLVFTCLVLFFAVPLLCSPRTMNIVSCCLVGGFCVTMAAAVPLHSSLPLIVTHVLRHASVPGYASVVIIAPFQLTDGLLTGLWVVVMVAGVCWQLYRAKGQPHFPRQRRRRLHRRGNQPGEGRSDVVHPPVVDENAPLLSSQEPPPSYQEVNN